MARVSTRFKVPVHLQNDLALAATSQMTSRSELVNRALIESLPAFDQVIAYRMIQPQMPQEVKSMAYTVDPRVHVMIRELSDRLGISRDVILRLSLDYYLNHVLKWGNPANQRHPPT